jgi:hypothetical protein
MAAADPPAAVPWTLRVAAGLVSAEALVEATLVAGRAELTPGLRVGLVLCVGLKWVFAWRVLRFSAGAMLGLLMLEGTTIVAALGAVETAYGARLAFGAVALVSIGLLSSSLHAFPSPTLPKV